MGGLITFDLDGTLVDSDDSVASCVNYLLLENGKPAADHESVKAMVGIGIDNILRNVDLPIDKETFYTTYVNHFIDKIGLYDDSLEALRRAAELGYRIVVATNRETDIAGRIVRQAGLEHLIDGVVAVRAGVQPKPAPDLLREAGSTMGGKVDAHIGDHDFDLQAAAAYGALPCCIYRHHNRSKRFNVTPAFASDRLVELLGHIDRAVKLQAM